MKRNITFLFAIFIFFSFISCWKPAKDASEKNFIDIIKTGIELLNKAKEDPINSKIYIKEIINNFNSIIVIKKDSSITIDSMEAEPGNDSIIYSIGNNKFMVNMPFYITLKDRKPVYSLDNITWYSVINNFNKSIEGIKIDYNIELTTNGNDIIIKYKIKLSKGKNPIIVNLNDKREVLALKKGMIFSDSIKIRNKEDLSHKILFIPKGTILLGFHMFRGDFIDSKYFDGKIVVKAIHDFYLYMNSRSSFLISIDKKKWGLNVISSTVKPDIEMFAKEDNEIFFNLSTTLNIDSSKISTTSSLLRLIFIHK